MGIKQNLQLSLALAKVEFKEKNEGSYLGIFWYLLSPLLLFLLLLLVFSNRIGTGIPNYPLYLLLGIIMFSFFQKTTIESTGVIHQNRGVIKSINFQRKSIIGSIVLKTLFSHIFEIALFVLFLLFFKVPIIGIIFYPLIFIFFCIFIYGSSLILSALAVYFIDLENIWSFVSYLIWFGTPIFYAIGGQSRLFYFNLFNPMYYFITIARELIIYRRIPELWMMIGAMGYSLLFLIIGLFIFNKLKMKFAEMV
ncbi:MAG: ABC transporter permease [Candidatus Hodarchaeota archaeon]